VKFPHIKLWHRSVPHGVWQILAFALAAGVVLVFATQWTRWEGSERYQSTDDAYLHSEITSISARVPGYVRAVPVNDYQRVHAGQVIAEIEDDDYRATVARSQANLQLAEAQLAGYRAQRERQLAEIAAAEATLAATLANAEQSTRDVRRAERLLATGSGSTEATERATTTHASLVAQLAQNRAEILTQRREVSVLDAQVAEAEASVAAARAALDLARIDLGYTRIRAPQDGELSQRQVFPGQYLSVGGQVTTLTPLPRVWVIANYRETQLTHVALGQAATVTVDTFPGHTLRGHVAALAPASGASFALLPPDNATGNFTKIVQRFSVKIVIDDADGLRDELRPGMSVVATIDTRSHPRVRTVGNP
jgi:membrane fusion protein, multidrug efflux system